MFIAFYLELTVKVTGVILCLQLRDELSFLPQEPIPVQTQEERMLFDLWGSTFNHSFSTVNSLS